MPLFRSKEREAEQVQVDFDRLPRHIAIIMDGNGRWAQKRRLPRTAGHAAGAENFRTIATYWVKMEFFGDLSPLPQELQDLCRRTREISKGYDGCQVNICLNYGGRDELLRAARAYAQDCVEGRADPNHLTAEHFAGYLFSQGVPDPDLVIRPSGELRLSNFLLWQSAYAEFYFTDVLWPDFSKEELHRAIAAYQSRSRRFGGI